MLITSSTTPISPIPCRSREFHSECSASARLMGSSPNYFVPAIPGKRARNMNAASQSLPTEAKFATSLLRAKSTSLEKVGVHASRYGLVLTLLRIGALKFTADEAHGIQPLVASSPLMSWLYRVFSVQAVSNLVGAIEIAVAALIA